MKAADTAGDPMLIVNASPHMVTKQDTGRVMGSVLLALIPALLTGAWYFGPRALLLAAVCLITGLLCEGIWERLMKQPSTLGDLSACVTGLILALNLPVSLPFWMAAIGCFTAIVIVKMLFGGLGRNFANPAIVGRIVLLLSFPTQMTAWTLPGRAFAADAVSGATPLAILAEDALSLPSLTDMFLGRIGGTIGETCVPAILIGGAYLILRRIISPIIPVSFLGTVFVIGCLYGALTGQGGLTMGLFHLCAGGAFFGAFFCATDYVTSPVTRGGRLIFGIGCGAVTMVIRLFCSYPEGVSFAILFMNILVPLIDRYCVSLICKKGNRKNESRQK